MRRLACVAGVALWIFCPALADAADVPLVDQTKAVRAAVVKGLALLEKSSSQFVKRGGCDSCHHQYLPAAALAVARQRGLVAGQSIHYMTFQDLPRERFLEVGAIPGGAGTVGYQLFSRAALKQPADEYTDAMVHYLKATQSADGRWQNTSNRPPLTYDDVTTTALCLRALRIYAPQGQRTECDRRVAQAAAWLREAKPASTQERAFQLLGLEWAGAGGEVMPKAARGLLAEQRSDGGWSQLPAMESDSYGTGMALVALHEGGRLPVSDAAYRRGAQFLLKTQLDDGSWHVKSRALPVQPYFESGYPHGNDQWISAAGASWAAWALALTVEPVKLSSR